MTEHIKIHGHGFKFYSLTKGIPGEAVRARSLPMGNEKNLVLGVTEAV
jgi:hypothetical protein